MMSGRFITFEEASRELLAPGAEKADIAKLMIGKLLKASETPEDAYDPHKASLDKGIAARRYPGDILNKRKVEQAQVEEARLGNGRALPGDRAKVPSWVLNLRVQGRVVTWDATSKAWDWEGGLFHDKRNQVGF